MHAVKLSSDNRRSTLGLIERERSDMGMREPDTKTAGGINTRRRQGFHLFVSGRALRVWHIASRLIWPEPGASIPLGRARDARHMQKRTGHRIQPGKPYKFNYFGYRRRDSNP